MAKKKIVVKSKSSKRRFDNSTIRQFQNAFISHQWQTGLRVSSFNVANVMIIELNEYDCCTEYVYLFHLHIFFVWPSLAFAIHFFSNRMHRKTTKKGKKREFELCTIQTRANTNREKKSDVDFFASR